MLSDNQEKFSESKDNSSNVSATESIGSTINDLKNIPSVVSVDINPNSLDNTKSQEVTPEPRIDYSKDSDIKYNSNSDTPIETLKVNSNMPGTKSKQKSTNNPHLVKVPIKISTESDVNHLISEKLMPSNHSACANKNVPNPNHIRQTNKRILGDHFVYSINPQNS